MAQIEVDEMYPACRRVSACSCCDSREQAIEELPLSLAEISLSIRAGYRVALYVDGWSEPWLCYLDVNDELRAQCPTAPKVMPLVVSVSRGARYTGCDCACHGDRP